ncbi:MAG: superoxide dismutase [Gemmatimonadaceae bacterium]|nr:superoxide dismutase [Chitinophagaceae bacterium]
MSTNKFNRRKFIADSAKAGMVLTAANLVSSNIFAGSSRLFSPYTSFEQTPLPYAYNALESAIDAMTMEIHYSKHASTYSKNAKEAAQAEGADLSKPIESVLSQISKYTPKLRNNAGGHFNHEFFWKSMKPGADAKPAGKLLAAIEKDFNSFDAFKTQFADAAKNRFGSGWAWLISGPDKKLKVISTPNQDNPLMDIAENKGTPLLALDVWEHAYYLRYQNRRPEYIENWWKVVNWEAVAGRM